VKCEGPAIAGPSCFGPSRFGDLSFGDSCFGEAGQSGSVFGHAPAECRIDEDQRVRLAHADAVPATVNLWGGVLEPVLAVPDGGTVNAYAGEINMSRAAVTWTGGTINILGEVRVRLPRAGSIGDWYGSASLNDPAGLATITPAPV